MSTYATAEQFTAWTAHLVDLDLPDDVTALLDRAARDIDSYLSWPMPITAGDRIDTSLLTDFQRDCLMRACVMQAAYRLTIGEADLVEDRPRLLSVPSGPTFSGAPIDRIGPDVFVLLAGAGLLRRTGTAPAPLDPVPLDPWVW